MPRVMRAREGGGNPVLRIGSLCSGYEGLGAAVMDVMGGELAWVADNDPGAAAILAHRFPAAPNLGDITQVDWAAVPLVDILCAGTPCQDVSAAGRRAGLRAGTRSGLWLEVVKAVRALRPAVVVVENVRGLLTARGDEPTAEHLAAEASRDAAGRLLAWLDNEHNFAIRRGDIQRGRQCAARTARVMGLRKRAVARCQWHEQRLVRAIGTVLGTLADLGYDAQWVTVSASDAGAAHKRERVFIVARPATDSASVGRQRHHDPGTVHIGGQARERPGASHWCASADAAGSGCPAGSGNGDGRPAPVGGEAVGRAQDSTAEDTNGAASGEWRQPAPGQAPGGRPRADAGGPGGAPAADTAGSGWEREALAAGHASADAAVSGRGAEPGIERGLRPAEREPGDLAWGPYEPAIRRWEAVLGRSAPRPTEPGRTGERLSPRFVEWLMGLPAGWVTDVPGLSRNQQLHALGNGVVPAQAAMALRLLLGAIEAGEAA